VSAVDYLVKPVTAERVSDTVARLRRRGGAEGVARLTDTLDHGSRLHRVVGKRLQQWHVLPIETIEAFIAERELVFALTARGRFLVNRTLRDLDARLDADRFVRVHKQAIVRITGLVLSQDTTGRLMASLPSGLQLAISRRHMATLRRRLGW
jgi:DNA-binding LytR/AlgR family response regulator